MRKLFFLPTILASAACLQADTTGPAFEQNLGQTDPSVAYFARRAGGFAFLTPTGLLIHSAGARDSVKFEFVNQNASAAWDATEPTGESVSYMIGQDSGRWVKDARRYRQLIRKQLYPGIDLVWHGRGNEIEYDFLLAPQADPESIRIRVSGAKRLRLEGDGDLVAETEHGLIRHRKPELLQIAEDGSRSPVHGAFHLLAPDLVGFSVKGRDPDLALLIDPTLELSSYLGGIGDDKVFAFDGVRSAGMTTSVDFPDSAYARRSGYDVFIRFGSSTTVVGGSGDEQVTSAAISPQGLVVVTGYTNSQDLPTLSRTGFGGFVFGWQTAFGGGATDGFLIAQFGTTSGLYATYVGGPGDDKITALSFAGNSNLLLAGTTSGRDVTASSVSPSSLLAPAGGTDGFLLPAFVSLSSTLSISPSSIYYFGGSGDDTPLAVVSGNGAYYVAGETSSRDFPVGAASQHAGSTDAFLLRLNPIFAPQSDIATAAVLLGGSAADRITGLGIMPDGSVVAAGTTSSLDFPSVQPLQTNYGGGASDGFITRYPADLSSVLFSTYLGGSGSDEVRSLATDSYGGVYIGGVTSSTDFPTVSPLQPRYGGGPADGFLVQLNGDGSVYQSTYLGGSGDDQILGLSTPGDFSTYLAGSTNSKDLPVVGDGQRMLSGPSDGLVAKITAGLLGVSDRYIGGKNFANAVSVRVGRIDGSSATPVTAIVADPSLVQLYSPSSTTGQSSITLTEQNQGTRYFEFECLSDSGGTDITLSAPGYAPRRTHVDCYPVELRSIKPFLDIYSVTQYNTPIQIAFYLAAFNPALPKDFAQVYPRTGDAPVTVQITSSNPAVLDPATASVQISGQLGGSANFRPVSAGATTLTFSSAQVSVPASTAISITVTDPSKGSSIQPAANALSAGFEEEIATVAGAATVTFQSSDPSRLLLATDPSQPGLPTLTIASTSAAATAIYGQALDVSDVTVTASATGQPDVIFPIHISRPTIAGSNLGTPLRIALGQFTTVGWSIQIPGNRNYLIPNPGSPPIVLSLNVGDPSVLTVSPAAALVTAATPNPTFRLTGLKAGTTTLSLNVPDGISADPAIIGPGIVTVTDPGSSNKPATINNLEIGQDLASSVNLTLPAPPTTPITVTLTVADPNLASIACDSSKPGASTSSVTIGVNGQGLSCSVYGLASSGRTTITANVPGYGVLTSMVTLDPSGFVWLQDTVTVAIDGSTPAGYYASPLDPQTLLPVGRQVVRPGISATPTVTSANPGIATYATTTNFGPSVVGVSAGTTTISLTQPSGFVVPSARQSLKVTVPVSRLALSVGDGQPLIKDTQHTLSVYGLPSQGFGGLTITSSDPNKVVISDSPTALGSGTLKLTKPTTIYMNILDDHGTVTLTASSPGLLDGSLQLYLFAWGLQLRWSQTGDPLKTTVGASPSNFSASITTYDTGSKTFGRQYPTPVLRPGAPPYTVDFRVSDSTVGSLTGTPLVLGGANSNAPVPTFQPKGRGTSTITPVVPSGVFVDPASGTLTANVSFIALPTSTVGMGRDTLTSVAPQLSYDAAPTKNLDFTVTSSDPAKVLVSRDPASTGSASITVTMLAGQRSPGPVYLHALGNTGTVPVVWSAPGFEDSEVDVKLGDTAVVLSAQDPTSSMQTLQASFGNPALSLRPGAGNLSLTLASSNPAVAAVPSAPLVIHPGETGATVTVKLIGPGVAVISMTVPAPFVTDPRYDHVTIANSSPSLKVSATQLTIGKDLEVNASVNQLPDGAQVTVRSLDPSRVLVAVDATTPGQQSLTLSSRFGSANFVLQGLSDNGTASVQVSVPGYDNVTISATLVASTVVFTNSGIASLAAGSQPSAYYVALTSVDPLTQLPAPVGNNPVRPGANLSVKIKSSDPSVAAPLSDTVMLTGPSSPQVQIRPLKPGIALITLEGPTPRPFLSGSEIMVVNVLPSGN